jgi:uncharacterized protein
MSRRLSGRIPVGALLLALMLFLSPVVMPLPLLAQDARAASLSSLMPGVRDLGRTQTLRVRSEGTLSFGQVVSRIEDMPSPERHLQDWGWQEAYERTFVSDDALRNDAFLVQITYQRFSSRSLGTDALTYFAGARTAGTRASLQAPHAKHPGWLKLGGPSDGGNEVTYYAIEGDVLVRVITVAAGDPTGDATDIMGRTLRLLGGGASRTTAPAPVADTSGNDDHAAIFYAVDAYWASRSTGTYTTPDFEYFAAPEMTGCGYIDTNPGPFYCPADQTIYLDTETATYLSDEEFVLGLFIAHEWGHHLEMLAGYQKSVFPMGVGEVFSLQLELAADCLAGVWAAGEFAAGRASKLQILHALDIMILIGDEAGSPLTAIDAHGTGEMRAGAFLIGFATESPAECESQLLDL